MVELLYELPEAKEDGGVYEITPDMINSETRPSLFAARKKKSA
jgi:hypothetical protein